MAIYFAGDYHFNHSNIIKYCNRPFQNVEEMNNALIRNHNSVVKKNDTVFVMGDFCLGNKDIIKHFILQLNGRKILIMGNHDGYNYKFYMEAGFEEVYKYPIIYKDCFILSHEPLFMNENTPYANIYAHVHDNANFKNCTQQSFCTSLERIHYKPIRLENIIEEMQKYKEE